MWELILQATRETIFLVTVATVISMFFGLILGFMAYNIQTTRNIICKKLNNIASRILNVADNIPSFIALLFCVPIVNFLISFKVASNIAMTIPVAIIGTLLFARDFNKHLNSIPDEIMDPVNVYGATRFQALLHIQLPEVFGKVIGSVTNLIVSIISLSIIAGIIGAKGLGSFAIDNSVNQFNFTILIIITAIIAMFIMGIRLTGNYIQSKI